MACNKYIIKDGKPGKDGLSAYEIAVQNGFIGTEQEWLDSLKGTQGIQGSIGLPGQDGSNGLNGQDGQSSFTSYVFTRQEDSNQPDVPTGGSFNNPLPNESRWTDGVPFGQGAVYMSYRIFTSDGLSPQQPVWSNPIIAADSALIDFEWSTVPTNPGNPTDNPNNWTNESSQLSIWMAVRTMSNGSWSDWNIIYIKGEKGEDGQAGVFTANIYAVNGSWNTAPALNRTERTPIGWSTELNMVNPGEYVWTSQALIDPVTNELVTDWTYPVRMSGTPGEDGDNGASIAYRGDWKDDLQYQGSNLTIDFVIYDDGVNGRQGYLARTDAGEIPIGTLPTDTDYWNGPIENVDALFTDFLVAYSAYIGNLTVGQIRTNPQPLIVPDENLASESTTIGYQPVNPIEDPTSQNSIFSRHGIRQYHPSGRISMYMGSVNNFEYTRVIEEVSEQVVVDGWAIITFEDLEGSPVFFVLDSTTPNGVRYAKTGADKYTPVLRTRAKTGTSTFTQADADAFLRNNKILARSYARFNGNPEFGDYDNILFSINIARQGDNFYQFTPGTGSSMHAGLTTDLSGTYFNGYLFRKYSNPSQVTWGSNDMNVQFPYIATIDEYVDGVVVDSFTIACTFSFTATFDTRYSPSPPQFQGASGTTAISNQTISPLTGSGTFVGSSYSIDPPDHQTSDSMSVAIGGVFRSIEWDPVAD